jgi:signal transduction histidine kinase
VCSSDLYKRPLFLQDFVNDIHNIKNLDIVVVDKDKKILADAIPQNVGTIFNHDRDNEVGQTIMDGKARSFIEKCKDFPEGIRQIAVQIKEGRGEIAGALIYEYTPIYNKFAAHAKNHAKTTIVITAFGLILAVMLGYIIAAALTKNITKLKKAVRDVAMGNLESVVDIHSKDEIGQLANSFNTMALHLKQHHEKQELLIKQIENANQELKDFSYIVSHDLKAPLRGISSLANWLQTDYGDRLDEEGKKFLSMLAGRVNRMHDMIEGILQYSRAGRIVDEKTEVDLNRVVEDVIDLLNPPENIEIWIGERMVHPHPNPPPSMGREEERTLLSLGEGKEEPPILMGRGAKKISPSTGGRELGGGGLPTVVCEKTKIEQVFQNLISNAMKYLDKPKGVIKIGYRDKIAALPPVARNDKQSTVIARSHDEYRGDEAISGKHWTFYVSDNGPGIEGKYYDKIFQIFQTLQPRDAFESTGVGLAIVKKIIEQNSGKIWVESKVGEGTTFWFTLPKA